LGYILPQKCNRCMSAYTVGFIYLVIPAKAGI